MSLACILSLLMLNLPLAPCEGGLAGSAREHAAPVQEVPSPEEAKHCCQADHPDGTQDDHCPPSCHCSCCHSLAVFPLVKQTFPSFAPEAAKPAPAFGYYQSDFHHYIWHPPQPA